MENIVAQMLRTNAHKLYFYSRSDTYNRENHMEIDFLITESKKIAPVEEKSNNYTSHASLDKFRNKFSSKIGNSYLFYSKDIMIKDGIIHLPFYMAMFLQAAPAEVFSAGIFFVYCSPNFEERQKYVIG